MRERVIHAGPDRSLVGILTEPEGGAADAARTAPTLIVLNSGIVHRVGPARLGVKLTRLAASKGLPAARFDHSGVGDSPARRDAAPFMLRSVEEAQWMMDALREAHGAERFILAGLCSGAATSFWAAGKDPRVVGVLMMNARQHVTSKEWDDFVQNKSESKRYLKRAFTDGDAWKRALTGKVNYRKFAGVLAGRLRRRVNTSETVDKVSRGLADVFSGAVGRGVNMLLVHSQGDVALDYLDVILTDRRRELEQTGRFRSEIIRNADHIFDLVRNHEELLALVGDWLDDAPDFGAGPVPAGSVAHRLRNGS